MKFEEISIDEIKMSRTAVTDEGEVKEGDHFVLSLCREGKEVGSILGIITPMGIKLLNSDT